MLRRFLYKQVSKLVFPNKGITHIKREPKLIVSLTSYPKRINVVPLVIDSLLRQSLKPDMVILWLAEEEFPQKEHSLPKRLRRYTRFGLQIRWCENIKSYKKLIPALLEYPDDIIVTADDDSIYPEDWLESLYCSFIHFPTQIHGHHAFHYHIDSNYNITNSEIITQSSILTSTSMLIGIGGILYPPHSLYKNVTSIKLFTSIAPTNDDFWFWAMAHLQGTSIRLVNNHNENIVCIDQSQTDGLWESVNSHGTGIQQFKNIINAFPKLKDELTLNK